MEARDILERIKRIIGETDLVWIEDLPGDPHLIIPKEKLRRLAIYLKGDQHLAFDTLMCLSGVHNMGEQDEMEVVYHLYSVRHQHQFVLKIKLDRPAFFPHFFLRVDSISEIWPAAAWMEREAYDMFGIHFVGHSDFRRLLLPTDWEGHPLQKDYQEAGAYRGVSTTREEIEGIVVEGIT
ncbi:MAG: NADH-quinone oxidoreductase subunit C [Deltaproteobacteria bacterium]|nr:MAG: NADH-quinone oxidoreductase subunit C [Deltaproteobacteria bacterium]